MSSILEIQTHMLLHRTWYGFAWSNISLCQHYPKLFKGKDNKYVLFPTLYNAGLTLLATESPENAFSAIGNRYYTYSIINMHNTIFLILYSHNHVYTHYRHTI